MFWDKWKLSKLARWGIGVVVTVGVLAGHVSVAHADHAGKFNWHEAKVIVDYSVDAPYFSMRCYDKKGKGVGGWKSNKPKGIYYRCSGRGSRQPHHVYIKLKGPFFAETGAKLHARVCTSSKRTCLRVKERRGKFRIGRECGKKSC